jgi:hypothetical protein
MTARRTSKLAPADSPFSGALDPALDPTQGIEETTGASRDTRKGRGSKVEQDSATGTNVLEGLYNREPRQRYRATNAGGDLFGDRILFTDHTGHAWTFEDVRFHYSGSEGEGGNFVTIYDDEGNFVSERIFDSGLTLNEWFDLPEGESSWGNLIQRDLMFDKEYNEGRQPGVDFGSGSGSGSGRRGAAAPVYQAPDEGAVRESVRNYVVATVGTDNERIIREATKAVMRADRAAWDGQSVDPTQVMKDTVRAFDEYQAIHQQRPASVDELQWVTQPQGKLRQLGLSAEQAENLGIAQAQAGASDEALVRAGAIKFQQTTGRTLDVKKKSLQNSMRGALSVL